MSLLLQGAGAGGLAVWIPPTFPTLSVSYAAAVTVRYEADTGIGVSTGQPMSSWADTAGSGKDYARAGSARPTWQSTGWDGLRPCVRFDGVDDYMVATVAGLTPPFFRFLVLRWNAAYVADSKAADGLSQYALLGRNSSTTVYLYSSAVNQLTTTPLLPHLYELRFNSLSTDLIIDQGTASNNATPPAPSQAGLRLGSTFTGADFAAIDICADVVTTNINGADQTLIANYLRTKWATP